MDSLRFGSLGVQGQFIILLGILLREVVFSIPVEVRLSLNSKVVAEGVLLLGRGHNGFHLVVQMASVLKGALLPHADLEFLRKGLRFGIIDITLKGTCDVGDVRVVCGEGGVGTLAFWQEWMVVGGG
jgi:hypothetical protein